MGSKNAYVGTPLAVTGDVIVVVINYRLGVLGFLADGPGKHIYIYIYIYIYIFCRLTFKNISFYTDPYLAA